MGSTETALICVSPDFLELRRIESPPAPTIYERLEEHQRQEEWERRELLTVLQWNKDVFIEEFKLGPLDVALCVDRLPANRYGHFRHGWNGFGLRGEIALNTLYMDGTRPFWKWLATLLHELLHAHQEVHGKPGKGNCHNREFREKAASIGLIIDEKGVTQYQAESPFMDLLKRLGVAVRAEELIPEDGRKKGASKLKKWSCSCPVNVRVGAKDFHAKCLICNEQFVLQSSS
ncbi:SprT-like family protein [Caulifigura coniformis]|uniref:SprT-like family protein n=1 Tax=Caulifigura coniformis TaxID=2527983 RepID=A0A517SAC0_9PLAN|nr:hypothetical protein [Caulifigura coniformis]QDT53026.1 SprT-like family protein [Caulifigura coniformis]